MKKKFFRPSQGKIISPLPIDGDEFADMVCARLDAESVRHLPGGSIRISVRGKILPIGYNVDIRLRHRRIQYSFGTENIFMAVIVATFAGLLIYKGRLDTYIFWAGAISGLIFWIHNVLTHGRISAAIRSVLPSAANGVNTSGSNSGCSITYQKRCPACGSPVTGFGSACGDCGISLRASQESSSRFPGYRLKYFYKKNTENS